MSDFTKISVSSAVMALSVALASHASAAIPVSGVTTSSTFSTYNSINLINGSGLSGALHDGNFTNKWLADTDDVTPTLTFDLGDLFNLTDTVIWNYGGGCCGATRNVNRLNIMGSTNGSTFASLGSFALSDPTSASFGGDTLTLSGVARYVRFDILSNRGDPNYTGLSEVQFNGANAAVPEPATWAMMILGMGLVGASIRRRKVRTTLSFS